jgi:hypothetical protein
LDTDGVVRELHEGPAAGPAGVTTLPGRPEAGRASSPDGGELKAADPESERWEREERGVGAAMAAAPGLAVRARQAGGATIGVLAGMGAAAHLGRPAWAVAAVTAYLAVAGLAAPAVTRWAFGIQQPQEPDWVPELAAYRAWLLRRVPSVPAATLAAADRVLGGLAGPRWRSAHLFIARYEDGKPGSMGGTEPRGNRLQVTLGDYVAEGDPEVAAATLAHEAHHAGRWPYALRGLMTGARARGPLVIGWAVPWPAVIPAVLALHVACMLLSWGIEISCDLGAAAAAGPAAMSATYQVMADSRRRRAAPAAKRAAAYVLYWAAAPNHPPIAVRRAVIRARYLFGGTTAGGSPGPAA